MKIRKMIIGAVLVCIGLPVVLFLIATAAFHVLNRTNGTIVSSGREREYLLHVPRSYDRARPTPLVISLHGAALWPAFQMEISRWNEAADEHGFIAVYPSGLRIAPAPFLPRLPAWRIESEAGRMEDARFISDLIDTLQAAYNIDPARIYVNGFSNGGGMALALSCTLSPRIAAVGTVAAALELPRSWCADPRPMPVIMFHGTADPFVPYNGGPPLGATRPFPSVSTWAEYWAQRNRCRPNPIESAAAADVTRLEYAGCADDAPVVVYTLRGGGHSWPGGKPLPAWIAGPTNRNIDATSQMWAFFRGHPGQK